MRHPLKGFRQGVVQISLTDVDDWRRGNRDCITQFMRSISNSKSVLCHPALYSKDFFLSAASSLPYDQFTLWSIPINPDAHPNFPKSRTNILHIKQLQHPHLVTSGLQSSTTLYSRHSSQVDADYPIPLQFLQHEQLYQDVLPTPKERRRVASCSLKRYIPYPSSPNSVNLANNHLRTIPHPPRKRHRSTLYRQIRQAHAWIRSLHLRRLRCAPLQSEPQIQVWLWLACILRQHPRCGYQTYRSYIRHEQNGNRLLELRGSFGTCFQGRGISYADGWEALC